MINLTFISNFYINLSYQGMNFNFARAYNLNMILERPSFETEDCSSGIENELQEYRLINKNLRRKIKERDMKIMQLFGYIDEASKQISIMPQSHITKSQHPRQRSIKLTYSENGKKGKENTISSNIDTGNIFKDHSISHLSKYNRQMRLPTLEKKSKFIYPLQDSIFQNPQAKSKMVRIPLERLRPLDSKEVKKRFLMKFQKKDYPIEQNS